MNELEQKTVATNNYSWDPRTDQYQARFSEASSVVKENQWRFDGLGLERSPGKRKSGITS